MRHLALALIAVMGAGTAVTAQDSRGDEAGRIRDRLAMTRITIDFTETRIEDVIAYIQEFSGLNFHIDTEARTKIGEAGITLKLKDVSLKTALKLLLRPRDLGCIYRDGVLLITTKANIGSKTITRVYDARDILYPIKDFPGPRIELLPPGSNMAGVLFDPSEEPNPISEEFLVDLVKTSTDDRSWDNEGASIAQVNGLLVISQSAAVHDEIRNLLDRVRGFK